MVVHVDFMPNEDRETESLAWFDKTDLARTQAGFRASLSPRKYEARLVGDMHSVAPLLGLETLTCPTGGICADPTLTNACLWLFHGKLTTDSGRN